MPPPAAAAPIHHLGVLVPDLPAAIAGLSAALGVMFTEPQRVTSQHRVDPGEFGDDERHESTSFIAWSRSGPPYYELIEARPRGLLSIETYGPGLHHAGMFVPDVDAEIERLAALGIRPQAKALRDDGGSLCCWTHPDPAAGLILEYLDERVLPAVQSWIETGTLPRASDAAR
jgi:catechol 2,3-dioxygenase-like lactoylglutathione lyase family enzyme